MYMGLVSWSSRTGVSWIHKEWIFWTLIAVPNIVIGSVALVLIRKRFGKIFIG
jgi:hypothetical protein